MTLPEAITYIRAWAARFDELEKNATPGIWVHADGYIARVDMDRDPKDDELIAESYQPTGYQANFDLIATLRNSARPLVTMALWFMNECLGDNNMYLENGIPFDEEEIIISTARALREKEESK